MNGSVEGPLQCTLSSTSTSIGLTRLGAASSVRAVQAQILYCDGTMLGIVGTLKCDHEASCVLLAKHANVKARCGKCEAGVARSKRLDTPLSLKRTVRTTSTDRLHTTNTPQDEAPHYCLRDPRNCVCQLTLRRPRGHLRRLALRSWQQPVEPLRQPKG